MLRSNRKSLHSIVELMANCCDDKSCTVDELRDLVPSHLTYGLVNPAPPAPDLDIPGRPVAAASA